MVNLHRIHALEWLPKLFSMVCVPTAVARELEEAFASQVAHLAARGALVVRPLTLSQVEGEFV